MCVCVCPTHFLIYTASFFLLLFLSHSNFSFFSSCLSINRVK